jgi:plastocyanin
VYLLIASLLMTLSSDGATTETPAGSIEGIVTFVGEVPKSATADDAGVRHDLIEVDKQTRGLRHAVLYLTGVAKPVERGENTTGRQSLVVDQVDYGFTPRVLAVRQGEAVTFKNSDPANHNVRASGRNPTNEFNVFTGVDGKYEHRFVPEPNYHPVQLGCDIHPWMTAWVYVFDHVFFAVSDERGRFRITSVPPGEYDLHIVQPAIAHREQRRVRVIANNVSNLSVVVRRDRK